MITKIISTGLVALGLLVSGQASAHQSHIHHDRDKSRHHTHATPAFNVDSAQLVQARLISKGVKNRTLTRYEEKKLRKEQKEIAHLEYKYRKNGLQSWERKTLKKRLQASRDRIYAYMNNREYRRANHKRMSHSHNKTSKHMTGSATFTLWIGN